MKYQTEAVPSHGKYGRCRTPQERREYSRRWAADYHERHRERIVAYQRWYRRIGEPGNPPAFIWPIKQAT